MNDRDMRMMYDTRNPYGSEGGYVVSSRGRGRGRGRGRRGDRGMDYGYDGRTIRSYPTIHPQGDYGDMNYDMPRRDYGEDMRGNDYRGRQDYGDMRGDGHHMHGRQSGYEPVEFMGYCQGYAGSPDRDYGRPNYYGDMRGDYRYDMRGRRDYGYDYGDYGETLSDKELEHWQHKLMSQLDEREKQMFHKDAVMQRVKQMGKQMEGFGEKELYTATLMVYTDYKNTIGQNVDMAVKLAYDWLADKDVAVKGAEKLATYYDCIVEGE